MTDGKIVVLRRFDAGAVTTVLCDADGNLFPSEEPAFDASVEVREPLPGQGRCPGGVHTRVPSGAGDRQEFSHYSH
jgi:hypothetical protein